MATTQTAAGLTVPCEVRLLDPVIVTEEQWRQMSGKQPKRLKKCDKAYWTWMLVGTAIFYVLSLIPLAISTFIPDYDLGSGKEGFSKWYEYWSYRGDNFYTTYFPLGNFFYYWIMLMVGFVYVNLVNLQNERKNPFLDSHYEYTSFIKTAFIYAPVLFLVTSMVELRGPNDLSGWCNEDKTAAGYKAKHQKTAAPMQSFMNGIFVFFEMLLALDLTSLKSGAANLHDGECYFYSRSEIIAYNYFVWTVGFFLGLQFTHMDQGIMKEFVLDPEVMKNWPIVLWIIFFVLVALLIALEFILWRDYINYELEWILLAWIGLVALLFGIKCIGSTSIHVHHYCIGFFVATTIQDQTPFLSFIQAIFNGIMIEGASRWGYDPIWTYGDDPVSKRIQSVRQAQQIRMARERGDNQPVPAGYLVKNVIEEADQA